MQRVRGFAMSAFLLNGHHASQTDIQRERHRHRVQRWLRQLPRPELRRRVQRENLAVGWFPEEVPKAPTEHGNCFVVRSADSLNGELLVRVSGRLMPVLVGLPNVPIYLVVVLRESGAIYYAGSANGVDEVGAYPMLRPLAIDTAETDASLFAAVHQGVLGEVGFRVDSRVYGVAAAHVGELQGEALPGLLHATVERSGVEAGIAWRGEHWRVRLTNEGAVIEVIDGDVEVVAIDGSALPSDRRALQVSDDGNEIAVYLDGRLLFGRRFADRRFADEAPTSAFGVETFEAHSRRVRLTESLDVGAVWEPAGTNEVVRDDFDGPSGEISIPWRRTVGVGSIERMGGGGARVRATRARPNPGRTVYVREWPDAEFADLEVTVVPPGTAFGEAHQGRGGLVLWQDESTYLIVNMWLDDVFGGHGSLSAFLRVDGQEDLHEAIWTNVGPAIHWGVPTRLRVVADRERWTASLDGRPVLHRAFADVLPDARPLSIRGVGLAANWEYGDDTGTVFRDFVGRVRG